MRNSLQVFARLSTQNAATTNFPAQLSENVGTQPPQRSTPSRIRRLCRRIRPGGCVLCERFLGLRSARWSSLIRPRATCCFCFAAGWLTAPADPEDLNFKIARSAQHQSVLGERYVLRIAAFFVPLMRVGLPNCTKSTGRYASGYRIDNPKRCRARIPNRISASCFRLGQQATTLSCTGRKLQQPLLELPLQVEN